MTTSEQQRAQFAKVRLALNVAEGLSAKFREPKRIAALNNVQHSGVAPLSSLPVSDLTSLIDDGHLVDIQVSLSTWRLHLRRGGADGNVTNESGSISEAVPQNKIDDLRDALAGHEFVEILGLLAAHEATVLLRVLNDPDSTGTHWITSHEAAVDALASSVWLPFARQLASGPTGLMIDDLVDKVLTNQAFTVYGPSAAPDNVGDLNPKRRERLVSEDEPFRRSRAGQGDPYPSPLLFDDLRAVATGANAASAAPSTRSVARRTDATGAASGPSADVVSAKTCDAFSRTTYLLAWGLLATTSEPIKGAVKVTVSGTRELAIDLTPPTDLDTQTLVDMYRWVALSSEIDRLYFVQQAVTLAVTTADDARSAAGPALRTARSLYDLSRRNSVAEVMSARRSAREVALAASRSAATQARDSAAKAVERTVLQVVAAAGLVIARLQGAINQEQTIALLVLIAALCIVSAVVTDTVTLLSARSGLDKELEDLDQFRDSLSEEDIKAIQGVGAVQTAKADLCRARITTWVTYGVATIAILLAILYIANDDPEDETEGPQDPTQTSQPSNASTTSPTPTSAPTGEPSSTASEPSPANPPTQATSP